MKLLEWHKNIITVLTSITAIMNTQFLFEFPKHGVAHCLIFIQKCHQFFDNSIKVCSVKRTIRHLTFRGSYSLGRTLKEKKRVSQRKQLIDEDILKAKRLIYSSMSCLPVSKPKSIGNCLPFNLTWIAQLSLKCNVINKFRVQNERRRFFLTLLFQKSIKHKCAR